LCPETGLFHYSCIKIAVFKWNATTAASHAGAQGGKRVAYSDIIVANVLNISREPIHTGLVVERPTVISGRYHVRALALEGLPEY
jgi:hypothetical protein